jgi:tetratricopeptide (TPR) repeat protein
MDRDVEGTLADALPVAYRGASSHRLNDAATLPLSLLKRLAAAAALGYLPARRLVSSWCSRRHPAIRKMARAAREPGAQMAWLLAAALVIALVTAARMNPGTLTRTTGLQTGDPRALFRLGQSMILGGEARRAVTGPLVQALDLMTAVGDRQGQADVLHTMGDGYQRLGLYPEAAAKYGEAVAARQSSGDERGVGVSLRERANVRLAMGRLADAEADLKAAQGVFEKLRDRRDLAEIWNDFGALYEESADYPKARDAYRHWRSDGVSGMSRSSPGATTPSGTSSSSRGTRWPPGPTSSRPSASAAPWATRKGSSPPCSTWASSRPSRGNGRTP